MLAFAANSILARMALVDGESGAWTFTLIRLTSGALALAILTRFSLRKAGNWRGAISLLIYVAGFSFAYLQLDAGLGALVLFATVQFTMLGWALRSGERLTLFQWSGFATALCALIWLLSPSSNGVQGMAAIAMIAAGIGWGSYSLIGRGAEHPTKETAGNFVRASLIALILSPFIFQFAPESAPSNTAIIAALASGILTSGMGYAIWYAALPQLSRIRAGIMQLTVPAIAALGGVIFLAEAMTTRLALSTLVILIGVGMATLSKNDTA